MVAHYDDQVLQALRAAETSMDSRAKVCLWFRASSLGANHEKVGT